MYEKTVISEAIAPVNKVVDKKIKINRKRGTEEEERHKGSLIKKSYAMKALGRFVPGQFIPTS
jgi:hypothetical protein